MVALLTMSNFLWVFDQIYVIFKTNLRTLEFMKVITFEIASYHELATSLLSFSHALVNEIIMTLLFCHTHLLAKLNVERITEVSRNPYLYRHNVINRKFIENGRYKLLQMNFTVGIYCFPVHYFSCYTLKQNLSSVVRNCNNNYNLY